jgi:mRNA-degrading endonuclease RelE of RelBE toxin-antitoxin system
VGYTVEIKKSAEKEMNRLPDPVHQRVSEKILALENDP